MGPTLLPWEETKLPVDQDDNCALPFDARHLQNLLEIPLPFFAVVLPRRRGLKTANRCMGAMPSAFARAAHEHGVNVVRCRQGAVGARKMIHNLLEKVNGHIFHLTVV